MVDSQVRAKTRCSTRMSSERMKSPDRAAVAKLRKTPQATCESGPSAAASPQPGDFSQQRSRGMDRPCAAHASLHIMLGCRRYRDAVHKSPPLTDCLMAARHLLYEATPFQLWPLNFLNRLLSLLWPERLLLNFHNSILRSSYCHQWLSLPTPRSAPYPPPVSSYSRRPP